MRRLLLALLCLGLCPVLMAGTTGKVSVKITDQQQKNLDGIFVQLLKAKDSAMVQFAVSGSDGNVKFDNISYGNYFISISQTGYETYRSTVFTLDDKYDAIQLPVIELHPKSLGEVTIVSKVPAIQHYAGKTVVNVQNSPLNAVGTIFDVIEKSPGVMVDQNDNISLQGKPSVMVMIDGRITPMSGEDLANLLKSMPAESADKIEFITNPSAKYDANGTAGIINIILKKDRSMGYNATIYGGYAQGIYPRSNDGFSFNDRTKKFNIFGSYNYAYRGNVNIINFNTDFYNGSKLVSSTQQNEYLKTPFSDNTARLGADYFASDKTTMGVIADVSVSGFYPSETTTTNEYDSLHHLSSYNITNSNSPSNTYDYALNLNLKHKFDSTGRELLFNADYALYNTQGYQNIATNYYDVNNVQQGGTQYLYGYLPRTVNIYSLKADYDGQLGNKSSLEAGAKTSYVATDNNVHVYDGPTALAPVDTSQTNHFIYTENINAGYITFNRSLHKANLQLGLRGEQTVNYGNQVTTDQTFSRNFFQLFPNLSLTDSLSADNQAGLSISRRIDRPTYNQLNPFSLFINPTFYLNGNPYLLPQNAYIFELSDAIKSQYFFTFTYTHTQYPITTVIEPFAGRPNIVAQTEENLSSSDNYTFNATVSKQLASWWTTSTSVDIYESHYAGDISNSMLSTNRFLWDVNSDNSISLGKKVSVDISGDYNSGYDLGYLLLKPAGALRAGVQVKVLKGKGSIKVNATDILWTYTTNGVTSFTGFTESVFVRRDTRSVGISFTYHIGGSSQSSLRSKGGAEDEKKRADTKTG